MGRTEIVNGRDSAEIPATLVRRINYCDHILDLFSCLSAASLVVLPKINLIAKTCTSQSGVWWNFDHLYRHPWIWLLQQHWPWPNANPKCHHWNKLLLRVLFTEEKDTRGEKVARSSPFLLLGSDFEDSCLFPVTMR